MCKILVVSYTSEEGTGWEISSLDVESVFEFENVAAQVGGSLTTAELLDAFGGATLTMCVGDMSEVIPMAYGINPPTCSYFFCESGGVGYAKYALDSKGYFLKRVGGNYATKCLNGLLRPGDLVMNTPLDDYPLMFGRVLEVHPEGSPDAYDESDNDYDTVHVEFDINGISEVNRAEIEAVFGGLYGEPRPIEELGLDDVIEAPDCLLCVNDITEQKLTMLKYTQSAAAAVAFDYAYNRKRYLLVTTAERNTEVTEYPTLEIAQAAMRKELDDAIPGYADEESGYCEGEDYELCEDSAWANAGSANFDWNIVEI